MIFFIINHFIKIYEIKKNLDKILNYLFFYLDEDAQIRLFERNRHHQILDIANIWFIVDQYLNKTFKLHQKCNWIKIDNNLLDETKKQYIKDFLIKNQKSLQDYQELVIKKRQFIGFVMDNLKKEEKYQIIFSEIEDYLKNDGNLFLEKLNTKVKELPEDLNGFNIKSLSLFLDNNKKIR